MNKKSKKLFVTCLALTLLLAMTVFTSGAFAATSDRVYGSDRYATAVKIADAGWTSATTAVLVNGEDKFEFADALTAAPLAKANDAPILLTEAGKLSAGVLDELKKLGVTKVMVIGGTNAVSDAAVNEITAGIAGVTVDRVSGADRFATSVEIAKRMPAFTEVAVANGTASADALSISSIAASKGMPILLTNKDALPTVVSDFLATKTISKSYVVGGTAVVADGVVPNSTRLYGIDRYATNRAVLGAFSLDYSKVYLAVSNTPADALAGSVLAAKSNSPIVLFDGSLAADTTAFVTGKASTSSTVIALGGTAVVPDTVVTGLVNAINGEKLAVESVSAINAKQLQVVFTQPVDGTATDAHAATNLANYYLNNTVLTGIASADLQSDEKTVIITLNTALTNGDTNVYTVEPVASSTDATILTPIFTKTETYSDTTAPTVTSVTSSTNTNYATSVTVNFSEPVASGSIKIDGSYVGAASGDSITFNSLNLDASKTHTLEYVNLTDYASTTANVTSYGTLTFSITKDTTAPVVSSIAPYAEKKILVTFSKKMGASAAVAANYAAANEALAPYVLSVAPLSTDTTGTQYVLTVTDSPIYSTTVTSHTVTVAFKGTILDSLGNAMTPVSKTVTLTKDTAAPAVTDIVAEKDASGKTTDLLVKYSEGLAANPSGVLSSGLTIVDTNGVLISAPGLKANSEAIAAGDTSVMFKFTTPAVMNVKWNVTVPSSMVTDNTEAKNASTGFSKLVDMSQTAATTFAVSSAVSDAAGKIITVTFANAVKGGAVAGSATDPGKYSINGTVLPAGTSITFTDATQKVATITLPAGFVAATDDNAVFRVAGVLDLNGLTVTPYVTTLKVTDNVKPLLNAATLNSDNTISLGFNETVSGLEKTDLVVKVNGTAVTLPTDVTLLAGTGADAGKWVLDLNSMIINDGTQTFFDMNGSGTYEAANDILLKTETMMTAVSMSTSPYFTSVTVGIVPTGTTPTGADAAGNKVTNDTVITVK